MGLDFKERLAVGNHRPQVLVLELDLTCLAEAGGQSRVIEWLWVAHKVLPSAMILQLSMRDLDGQYCHPTGQHPSISKE